MMQENGFRETEIGLIPCDWAIRRISEIARIKYGKQKPKNEGRYSVIGSSGIYAYSDVPLIDFETLIVGRKGNAGTVQLTLGPCWPADTTFYLEWLSEDVNVQFLYYFMSAHRLSGEHAKTTLPSIQRQDLENYLFPVPSIQEQSKIVMLMGKLQQAIEQQGKIIEKTKELKRSLMHRLFTYGLRGEGLKEPEIGLIPKSWEIKSISDISDKLVGGGTPSTKIPEYWNGNVEWTTSKRLGGEIYLYDGEKRISEYGLNNSSTNLIPKDNLLISTRVTVGKAVVNKVDIAISQDLTGMFINKDRFSPEFIAYQFKIARIQNIFDEQKRGATIKGITREDLKKIKLAMPNIKEQKEVANILSNVDKKIRQVETKKQVLQSLFKSMLQLLMTGQVRVKDIDFGEDYE